MENNNYNCCEWFNSTERVKIWEKIDKEENQSVLYDRLLKQYEILGVVASLITATLGMVLDNKNIYDDYKFIYNLINGLGIIFSLSCIVACLIITSLIGGVEKKNILLFVKAASSFLSLPLICIMIGLTSMYICVTMYFGGILSWILFPFSIILYFCGLIFYFYLRNKVILWANSRNIT
tara:strand:- start:848 stop:1384 length:537 start_codon:yes stop_codon:yes gene_type:complete